MLSALSAYLLKSLRPDNGSAAKITLWGPGRAGFLSPNPRPHPIRFQPWPCWLPFFLSPGRPLPARTACTCAWRAPPSLPDPDPPRSSACRAGRTVGARQPLGGWECQGWFCLSPGNSAWEGVCVCGPNATSTEPWHARKLS